MKRKRANSYSSRKRVYRKRYTRVKRRPRRKAFRSKNPFKKSYPRYVPSGRWSAVTFPSTLFKKFQWENLYTLHSTNDLVGNKSACMVFRLNSPYDPDRALGPGQKSAEGWSIFMNNSMYRTYLVLGAKVKIIATNVDLQAAEILMGYGTNSTLGDYTSPAYLDQMNGWTAQANIMEPIFLGSKDSGKMTTTRSFYIKPYVPFGITRRQYLDDTENFGASYNGNPNNTAIFFFHWNCANPGATVYGTIRFQITYYVQCFNNLNAPYTSAEPADDAPGEDPQYPWVAPDGEDAVTAEEPPVGTDPVSRG